MSKGSKEILALVYVLTDSTGFVFYVGCTTNSLKQRLAEHISNAKKNWPYTNVGKNEKIRSLNFSVLIKEVDRLLIKSDDKTRVARVAEKLEYQ